MGKIFSEIGLVLQPSQSGGDVLTENLQEPLLVVTETVNVEALNVYDGETTLSATTTGTASSDNVSIEYGSGGEM